MAIDKHRGSGRDCLADGLPTVEEMHGTDQAEKIRHQRIRYSTRYPRGAACLLQKGITIILQLPKSEKYLNSRPLFLPFWFYQATSRPSRAKTRVADVVNQDPLATDSGQTDDTQM